MKAAGMDKDLPRGNVFDWERRYKVPKLKGSEKQASWARTIRWVNTELMLDVMRRAEDAFEDQDVLRYVTKQDDEIMHWVLSHREATWWISRRDLSGLELMELGYKEIRKGVA